MPRPVEGDANADGFEQSKVKRELTIAQQNFPQATLALSEYSEMDTFWSMIPSAKLSSLDVARMNERKASAGRYAGKRHSASAEDD